MMHILAVISGSSVYAWAVAHSIVIYYIFSVLLEQLPAPDATSGKFYSYFYGVIQIFAANWKRSKDAVKTAAAKP